MRTIGLAVVLALALAAGAQAQVDSRDAEIYPAESPATDCSAGTTLFLEGGLRIFAVSFAYATDLHDHGSDVYACLDGQGPPMEVGENTSDDSLDIEQTTDYALADGRYLASFLSTGDEGGGYFALDLVDLKTHRRLVAREDFSDPGFALLGDGHLVGFPDQLQILGGQTLSRHRVRQLKSSGATVYWTEVEHGIDTVHEATEGAAKPVRYFRTDQRRAFDRNGNVRPVQALPCAQQPGTTIAAAPGLRVFTTGTRRLACRAGSSRLTPVPPGAIRLAGNRWVLVTGPDGDAVELDAVTGRVVTRARTTGEPALLTNGTLAWIDADTDELKAKAPTAAQADVLAFDGATNLAASANDLYWTTEQATAHRWPAPALQAGTKLSGSGKFV